MNRLKIMATALAGIGVVLGFAGCGLEDSMLKTQIEAMVREQVKEQEDIDKLYDVGECVNYTISPEEKGYRRGSIDVGLKNKATGKMEMLTYAFKYNTENDMLQVGIQNPMQALKLLGIEKDLQDLQKSMDELQSAADALNNL